MQTCLSAATVEYYKGSDGEKVTFFSCGEGK